jgi:hypothetical protein
MKNTFLRCFCLLVVMPVSAQETVGDIGWTMYIGGSGVQEVVATALGADGATYAAGTDKFTSKGFVTRYDVSGSQIWLYPFESPVQTYTQARGVAVLGDSVFVVATRADYTGGSRPNLYNFLMKHRTSDGQAGPRVQVGVCVPNPLGPNGAALACPDLTGIFADATGLYVTGTTYEVPVGATGPQAFVAKFSPSLDLLWTRQFSFGKESFATSVSGNGASVCASGNTVKPEYFNRDAFVVCLTTNGTELWKAVYAPERPNEYSDEQKASVYVSESAAYVAGWSEVQYTEGFGKRAFLLVYDLVSGSISRAAIWDHAWINGISGTSESVFLIGTLTSPYAPQSTDTNFGTGNISVRKCDSAGNEIWTFNFLVPGSGASVTAAADAVIVGGSTRNDFISYGTEDGVVARIREIPLIRVPIDVKPGDDENTISLKSNGGVPIAIFSDGTFDARLVNPLSISILGAGLKISGKQSPMFSYEDINKDGRLDLLVHIDTEFIQFAGDDQFVRLDGRLYDGSRIRGKDRLRIVP